MNGKDDIQRLAIEARAGDQRAFTDLYRLVAPRIRRHLVKRLGDLTVVDDLAADSLSESFQALCTRRYDPQRGTFSAFAHGCTCKALARSNRS